MEATLNELRIKSRLQCEECGDYIHQHGVLVESLRFHIKRLLCLDCFGEKYQRWRKVITW